MLISVYGCRRLPTYGVKAMFSRDEGETWDVGNIVVEESTGDCGYPSSVILKDGNILTVFYGRTGDGLETAIKQVIWTYEEE